MIVVINVEAEKDCQILPEGPRGKKRTTDPVLKMNENRRASPSNRDRFRPTAPALQGTTAAFEASSVPLVLTGWSTYVVGPFARV
jgi:hypothetical protein